MPHAVWKSVPMVVTYPQSTIANISTTVQRHFNNSRFMWRVFRKNLRRTEYASITISEVCGGGRLLTFSSPGYSTLFYMFIACIFFSNCLGQINELYSFFSFRLILLQ